MPCLYALLQEYIWGFLIGIPSNIEFLITISSIYQPPGSFLKSLRRSSRSMPAPGLMPWQAKSSRRCSKQTGNLKTSKDGKFSAEVRITWHLSEMVLSFELSIFRQNYCRLGGFTEWKALYYVCKDKDGFLPKDTTRAVYDGSLFERLENERKAKESTS